MRATFFGLEIGKTGLTTAQFGMDVTGHNISNLDTAGYTRQRIVSTAYDPFSTIGRFAPVGQGLVGGGVRVQILDQIRSAYLDRRFRTESNAHAFWDTRAQSLSYIESFFDNVNEKTSINYSIAQFFESMKILAEDPVAGAPRTLMQTSAMDLVQQLNLIYQGLIDFQKVENRAVETKVGDINRMAEDIAALNKAIYTFEITGMIANDLRDKRNLLIDQLSTYVDIEYEEYPDPLSKDMIGIKHDMLRIRVGGEVLVDHDRFNTLGIGRSDNVLGSDEEPRAIPYWMHLGGHNPTGADLDSAALNMNMIKGGQLKAHIDMRDGMGGGVNSADRGVPYYIEMVNNLARSLMQEINAQHIQGWSDNPDGTETDIHFFSIKEWNVATQDYDIRQLGTIRYYMADGTEIAEDDPLLVGPPPLGQQDHPAFAYKTYTLSNAELKQITAKNLTLSEKIQDSAFNIAASSMPVGRPLADGTSGDPEELQRHNNKNMNALYDLFRKTGMTVFTDEVDAGGNLIYTRRDIGSFDEYGTTIRFDVANTLHTAKQTAETSRILTLAANNQRTAVAGVSLDEEMVGLVKYNHAYNGAARVITAMDDLLDRLINGTGRVGL